MKKSSALISILICTGSLFGQIRILEVDPGNDRITIKNFGGPTVDISSYRLCARFVYTTNLTSSLESGNLNLAAGETVILSWPLNDVSSDLGIYLTSSFTSASAMVDFTQWGASFNIGGRESVAVTKGIWSAGDFITGTQPYNYIGDGDQSESGVTFWQASTNTATDIITFVLPEQTGSATPNLANHTVNIEVTFGTSVTSLTPTITLSSGATISPLSGVAQDFTNPVTYTVTAEDGTTTQNWTVTVTVAPPNTATDIITFVLPEETGSATPNLANHTVNIEVAFGTSVTSLTPNITLSSGATVSPLSGVAQDFTNPVPYIDELTPLHDVDSFRSICTKG